MTTFHDFAAAKTDEALSLVESGIDLDKSRLGEILKSTRSALNKSRYLTACELADRWRCSTGALKRLRMDGTGPVFFRPSNSPRGAVLYQIAAIEEFERTNFKKGTKENV